MVSYIDAHRDRFGVESIGSSWRHGRISAGSRTSRTWPPGVSASTWHSCSTRWRRPSTRGVATPSRASYITAIALFTTEVSRRKESWRLLETVEFATRAWVDWFDMCRLLGPIGDIPPAELEAEYYTQAAVA